MAVCSICYWLFFILVMAVAIGGSALYTSFYEPKHSKKQSKRHADSVESNA